MNENKNISEKTLMKKTKQDLVAIILKDNVTEKNLLNEIKELTLREEQLNATIEAAFEDYKEQIDNHVAEIVTHKRRADLFIKITFFSVMINIVLACAIFFF